jgi:hypothetical protein
MPRRSIPGGRPRRVIPTRASDLLRCVRGRGAGQLPGPPVPVPTALIFRGGRLETRLPRWPAHEFAESDYRHGSGTLRLRIVHVAWERSVIRDGATWLHAESVELTEAGLWAGRRQILIRAERLPAPLARKRPRLRV